MLVVVLLAAIVIIVFLYRYFFLRLQDWTVKAKLLYQIPGPKGLDLIRFMLSYTVPSNQLIQRGRYITQKYGNICSIFVGTMFIVLVRDAEIIETVFSSRVHTDKGNLYRIFEPWLGKGLITANGKRWHSKRKALTPAFHFSILETFYDTFVQNSTLLLENLKKEVSSEGFDVFPYINYCTMDIVCEAAMGVKVNAQRNSSSEYVRSVKRMNEMLFYRILRPWLWSDLIYKLTSTYTEQEATIKILHNMSYNVIEERRKKRNKNAELDKNLFESDLGIRKKKMFLDLLLDISENSKEHFTDEELREQVDTFIFAGHDTTSAALSWTLYLLGSHQNVQDRVVAELQEVIGPTESVPTMKQLSELKYLECVIKEGLRLFPPVPNVSRTLPEDVLTKGYTIPAGTMINVNLYELHRDPKYFPNPENFNPENFSLQNTKERHPYAYIPFSAGPRNCIGQRFALMEEKVILAMFLLRYKIISLEKLDDISITAAAILLAENGIWVQISERRTTQT